MYTRMLWLVPLVAFAAAAEEPGTSVVKREAAMIEAWKRSVLNDGGIDKFTDGEDLGWQVSPYLRAMVLMAEVQGDRDCLDRFCVCFEKLMAATGTDIDGLFGWPTAQGSYGRQGKRCIVMDDGLLCEPAAHFVALVRKDPELKMIYGERAEKYLAFIEEKILPKWKESWLEVQDKTAAMVWESGQWKRGEANAPEVCGVFRFYQPGKKPGMSLPLNQFWHVARLYLALHDATGNAEYLDKATKMARTGKYLYLETVSDRVQPWCYWRPVYDGDFKESGEPVHWVGAHPERSSYASFEAGMMAEFHRRKIVFTDEDIARVVKLNLSQWNKDFAAPKFDYQYERRPGYTKPYPSTLWSCFAGDDATIAKLSAPGQSLENLEKFAGKWAGLMAVPEYFRRKLSAAKAQ